MKKIDIAKNLLISNKDMLSCPKCHSNMFIKNPYSLICQNNHCFDLSKRGYVNFLLGSVKVNYNKEMLNSRYIVSQYGFFNPIIDKITQLIRKKINTSKNSQVRILDAGCGEGYHLSSIIKNLKSGGNYNLQGIGIDISKDGISIASSHSKEIIWCVGDLANTPYKNGQFDIITNIFSPSNYFEFNRILRDDGLVIKVVPGPNYLIELRNGFYQGEKDNYSNENVLQKFKENFHVLYSEHIHHKTYVEKKYIKDFIKMTPLSWGSSNESIVQFLNQDSLKLSVDFIILVGIKQSKDQPENKQFLEYYKSEYHHS